MQDRLVSQEGLEKAKADLKNLEEVERPEIVARLEAAKELGDLSENAEYHDAKDQLALTDNRISELREMISFAVVVKSQGGDEVGIGSTVSVSVGGKKREFVIVGASEADPAAGKISNESPIGKALIGHVKGDEVEVTTPAGKTMYRIENVA